VFDGFTAALVLGALLAPMLASGWRRTVSYRLRAIASVAPLQQSPV
jgi:hypothetical protein